MSREGRLLRRCARLLHERTPQHSTRDFDSCPECREWRIAPDDDIGSELAAARALADELADRVNENAGIAHGVYAHPGAFADCPHTPCCDDRAALAKWEASRGDDERCGAWGGCTLPKGHNKGQADVPANAALAKLEASK